MQIENYHVYSMRKEREYHEQLLIIYGYLLANLNDVKDLSQDNINRTMEAWHKEYDPVLEELNVNHLNDLHNYANTLFNAQPVIQETFESLREANDAMLNVTSEYVRQKFIEIGVNERAYGASSNQVNSLMEEVYNTTVDKLETYAVQSTISNLKQFIITVAAANSYTQYKWHTQRDARVRPLHAKMDKRWFYLADPEPMPLGMQPGIDWGCRCFMSAFR